MACPAPSRRACAALTMPPPAPTRRRPPRDHLTDPRVQHVTPMEDVARELCASLTRLRSNDEPDPPNRRVRQRVVRGRGRPYAASRGGPPTRHREVCVPISSSTCLTG